VAKARPKTQSKPKGESLESVFDRLQKLLSHYAPPFKTSSGEIRNKQDFHIKTPRAVVIPGSYGNKPVEPAMASIILQKGYVGFYFMPVYMNATLQKKLSPALMRLLKGKTCFYIKTLDDALQADVKIALDEGVKCFEARGWI
jgi:hypothetical protein